MNQKQTNSDEFNSVEKHVTALCEGKVIVAEPTSLEEEYTQID